MARTMIDGLAQAVAQNRTALLALTTLKNYDNYTFTHMVNVSLLVMGQARGWRGPWGQASSRLASAARTLRSPSVVPGSASTDEASVLPPSSSGVPMSPLSPLSPAPPSWALGEASPAPSPGSASSDVAASAAVSTR